MLATRLLIAGGGASFAVPATEALVALYNGSLDGSLYAIGAATFDGATWTRDAGNPVLEVGTAGAWDDATVKDPWLLWDGSQYVCYYSGFDGTKYQVGRATASDVAGPWTKDAGNPLVTVGAGGAFDDAGCSFPVVLRESATDWKLWYTGYDGADWHIGYATSADGSSWTKVGQVLTIGSAGQWDDEGVVSTAIAKDGATYYLYYGGTGTGGGGQWQGGVVTFSDPEGTYTRSGSNPVLPNTNAESGGSQLLTADTESGSAIVEVGSTAAWSVGEPMALTDGNSETFVAAIASIDSGTQITLDANAPATYAVASGGTIRPMTHNSVQPRTVRAHIAGGYEMFLTAFQPVEDLSPGGTKLREVSMRATSATLDGTWTYDYDTGLLFGLDLASWDGKAAENPSAIAA